MLWQRVSVPRVLDILKIEPAILAYRCPNSSDGVTTGDTKYTQIFTSFEDYVSLKGQGGGKGRGRLKWKYFFYLGGVDLKQLDITGSNDTPSVPTQNPPVDRSTTAVLLGAALKPLRP